MISREIRTFLDKEIACHKSRGRGTDWIGWYLVGVKYRAPYGANNSNRRLGMIVHGHMEPNPIP